VKSYYKFQWFFNKKVLHLSWSVF